MINLEPEFQGRIERVVADSEPWWPEGRHGADNRPNVLVVVLDDTGWSDFGCFGSEISTAVVDSLAADGLRYTNFHVTPLCSPTRACLLTGRNHHAIGMRFLADTDTGFPNSRGRIHPTVATLPELLRREGYGTYLTGKWHLTPRHEITPAGPYDNWPLGRGFERFYGFLDGCTDQYTPELYEDNHPVEPSAKDGYHLSVDLVERAISYVTDHVAFRPNQPFYLQVAFGATHSPFQVPHRYVSKYVETFSKGWDSTREDRLRRQQQLGVTPSRTRLAPRNPGVAAWISLSSDQQSLYTWLQAAYAGFLEHTDAQLGRLVEVLGQLGVLNNTVIVVMSDNGASREGGRDGAVDVNAPYSGIYQTVDEQLDRIGRIGGPQGPAHYPEGWAMAGNTPFRRYKQFVDLGGVRSPLVVCWPGRANFGGAVRDQFVHVIDLAPTILDVTGASDSAAGMDGRSFLYTFDDPTAPAPRGTQYFETLGHRAIWHLGWKAVTEHEVGSPYEMDVWRLYDTTTDFSECHDLAAEQPERLQSLQQLWWQAAEQNLVLPLDDRPLRTLLQLRPPGGIGAQKQLLLRPGNGHLPVASAITGSDRSMRVSARLNRRGPRDEGVIIASGDAEGGYVLYVQRNRLVFEHAFLGERVICAAEAELPPDRCTVGFVLARCTYWSAQLILYQAEVAVGNAEIPTTSGHPSFWGMDVGRDAASQVSPAYDGAFPFPPGALLDVTIEFAEDRPSGSIADAIDLTE